ncbi:MAG: hypothetical protein WBP94_05830, partial [Rhodomicrobiaceae bacterium]
AKLEASSRSPDPMRIAGVVIGLLVGSSAAGIEPAPGTYHYRIHHQIFGDIGEHQIQVSRDAGQVVVEHSAHLGVRPWGRTDSGCCFDRLPGVVVLELGGA